VEITEDRIRSVLAGLLAPIAATLLRCGVSYSEFSELAKCAFVDAASNEFGVRNRPTNIARVSVMTGLSRKEVSRIRRNRRLETKSHPAVTLPAAVLNAWHSSKRYREKNGEPKVLPFAGPGLSFSSLVRSVSKDIPAGAMRQELVRSGAVRRVDRTNLVPVKRHFVPDSVDERILVGLELGLRRLAETVAFNSAHQQEELRFQRFVEGELVSSREAQVLKERLHAMLVDMSVTLDDVISNRRRRKSPMPERSVCLGVGLYYFQETIRKK